MPFISIRALSVADNKNGAFTIELAGQELSEDDRLTLERLFPSLADRAFDLLNAEALVASIPTPGEICRKPDDEHSQTAWVDETPPLGRVKNKN